MRGSVFTWAALRARSGGGGVVHAPEPRERPLLALELLGAAEARRLTWYGVFDGDVLVAVGGLEHVRDVALLRHGYVLPEHQRSGVGALLREHLEQQVKGATRIIVGTYAGNYKARGALDKAGYRLSADPQAVLRAYS